MRRLNRYLGKTVLASTIGALMVLVSLIIISELVAQLGDLKGDYTFVTALRYVGLLIPGMVYDYLSYATFLGCVIGLGVHASANELVILRAAGVSLLRMGWAVMRPVLLVIVIGFLWGEYVTPVTAELAENTRAAALGEEDEDAGVWHRDGEEFAYFESVQSNGRLFGISRYRFDDEGRLLSTLYAEEGIYQKNYWQLENGTETRFEDGRAATRHFVQQAWRTDLSPEQLKLLVLEPESLSIRNLYRYAQSRDRQGLDSGRYWLSFWQKVMQPLTILGLVLVGISFIFGSLRESSMGFRLALAVLVGIVFEMSQNLLGTSSLALGFPPALAVLMPSLISIGFGAWLLNRN
ncbi:LPS export ABC transporter permease LptG [Gilvimarinus sp. F26214L]|uniref:LPS export ABC transporter permease LptG n=1 Tax=Gilvimarinus sp. DZF01 TaxID=3461371 RepID=UPI00404541EA